MARDTRLTHRIPVRALSRTRPSAVGAVSAVSVFEPVTNDEVIETFEQLCDLFGNEAGDNFLALMDAVAQQRGLVDSDGKRIRRAAAQRTPQRTGKLARSITGRPLIVKR